MTVYDEMKLEDLEHTLNRLERGLETEVSKRKAAERALKQIQQADEEDDGEDSQRQGDEEEEEGEGDPPSSQLKRSQTALELNYKKAKKMKKQDSDYEPTAGDIKRKAEKICRKAADKSSIVNKCLHGVSKGIAGSLRRDDFDAALEILASKISEKCGVSKAQGMSFAMDTPEGQQLYAGHYSAVPPTLAEYADVVDSERSRIAKAKPGPPALIDAESPGEVLVAIEKGHTVSKSDLEGALDALASKYQASSGLSFYKAYSAVLDSAPGQAIYKALVAS